MHFGRKYKAEKVNQVLSCSRSVEQPNSFFAPSTKYLFAPSTKCLFAPSTKCGGSSKAVPLFFCAVRLAPQTNIPPAGRSMRTVQADPLGLETNRRHLWMWTRTLFNRSLFTCVGWPPYPSAALCLPIPPLHYASLSLRCTVPCPHACCAALPRSAPRHPAANTRRCRHNVGYFFITKHQATFSLPCHGTGHV